MERAGVLRMVHLTKLQFNGLGSTCRSFGKTGACACCNSDPRPVAAERLAG